MTTEEEDQWLELLYAGKVTWEVGMAPRLPGRAGTTSAGAWLVTDVDPALSIIRIGNEWFAWDQLMPVLNHPVARGFLLEWARGATGFSSLYCRESRRGGWVACGREQVGGRAMTWRGPTEEAALMAAIKGGA